MATKAAMLSSLKSRLALYLQAEAAILLMQEYTIKDRTFKRPDLPEVRKTIKDLQMQINKLEGSGGPKSFLAVSRDY